MTPSAGHSLLNTLSAAFPLRSTSSCLRLRTAGPTHLPPLLLCQQLQHYRASPGPTPQPSHRRGRPSAGTAPLSPRTSSSRSPLTAQHPVGHSAHSGKRPRLGRPPAPLTARVSAASGTWAPQEEKPFGCCDHRRRGNGRITHPTAPLPLTAADARPYDRPPRRGLATACSTPSPSLTFYVGQENLTHLTWSPLGWRSPLSITSPPVRVPAPASSPKP